MGYYDFPDNGFYINNKTAEIILLSKKDEPYPIWDKKKDRLSGDFICIYTYEILEGKFKKTKVPESFLDHHEKLEGC